LPATIAAGRPIASPRSLRNRSIPRVIEKPFFHLEFDRVFPDDIYAQILALMPDSSDCRPMHGRSKVTDATPTRVKIDLFPEYIRNLPAAKRALWDVVGRALCADQVKQAFIRRLVCRSASGKSLPKSACSRSRFSPAISPAI
jgi:hypothetical protein